ncbi:hypothetical protein ES703_121623 [subsurface metagenome]
MSVAQIALRYQWSELNLVSNFGSVKFRVFHILLNFSILKSNNQKPLWRRGAYRFPYSFVNHLPLTFKC